MNRFPPGENPKKARIETSVTGHEVARLAGSINYLATPAIAAYFDVREHEAYYLGLKRVGPRPPRRRWSPEPVCG
jgi:hypothetical protein